MTPTDELKRLLAAATKGPWKSKKSVHGSDYRYVQIGKDDNYTTLELKPADAALIVAAVNAMPELIALREKMERIMTAVESVEIDSSVGMLSAKMKIAVALDQIAAILKEPTP